MKTIQQIREASGGKEAYQKFFNSILKKFGVDSPSELKGDKKKEFFDAIDKGWDGDNEKAESVSEASNLKGGRGKAEIDINWLGSSGDAKFISTKYKIKIKKTSNGAILSGDKQKILAYLQGKEYDMDAEDIKDLYPELVETYDDPDDYESEKDVTLNPDEDPLATGKSLGEANSALLKKAQAIASKLSGNMTKAVAEIEKLKKGLSDDKKVMAMLKTANEDISEAHVRAVDFEKTSKEIGKLKSGVDQSAIKQIAKYFNVMFKNSSLKIRDDAVLAVNKLKGKLSRDTRVEIDKILTTNNLMKNGNIMVEAAMKKNPAIDNNPEVKAARKAHAAGDWDGNVDKNGEAIVHIKGKPYTVTNNNESVEEAKMSGKEKKHYASLMRIALAGRKANPDFTSSIASNGDFVVSDRGNVVARLKKGTFKYFHQMKESVEEARLDKADYDAIAKMETGGYRPKVVNKETGKAMYVAGVYFKDEKSAKGHAQAYLDGYAAAGERRASKATAAYNKSNASKIKESVSEAKKLKAGRGKATIDVNWTGGNDGVKDAFKKHKIKIKPTSNGAIITGDKKGILDFLSGTWYDMGTDDIEDLYPELMESIARVTLVNEAIKVFAKKSGYVFYKDTVKDIAMLSYKGKVISSGDFDQGADGWFMELHQRGMEGQKFFQHRRRCYQVLYEK